MNKWTALWSPSHSVVKNQQDTGISFHSTRNSLANEMQGNQDNKLIFGIWCS